MSGVLGIVVAQGVPLAPPLTTRLIALAVVEIVLLSTAAFLYVRWVQLKNVKLDEWWERRLKLGLSAKSRYAMQASEEERRAAAGDAPLAGDAPPAAGDAPQRSGGSSSPDSAAGDGGLEDTPR